jgi:hypothetical protein
LAALLALAPALPDVISLWQHARLRAEGIDPAQRIARLA